MQDAASREYLIANIGLAQCTLGIAGKLPPPELKQFLSGLVSKIRGGGGLGKHRPRVREQS